MVRCTSVPAGAVIVSDRITSLREIRDRRPSRPAAEDDEEMLTNWEPARATSFGSIRRTTTTRTSPARPRPEARGRPGNQRFRQRTPITGRHTHSRGTSPTGGHGDRWKRRRHSGAVARRGSGPRFHSRRPLQTSGSTTDPHIHSVCRIPPGGDETWSNGPNPPSYSNTFTAFPAGASLAPARTIKRPRMAGIYSATVTEYPDALGRIN